MKIRIVELPELLRHAELHYRVESQIDTDSPWQFEACADLLDTAKKLVGIVKAKEEMHQNPKVVFEEEL